MFFSVVGERKSEHLSGICALAALYTSRNFLGISLSLRAGLREMDPKQLFAHHFVPPLLLVALVDRPHHFFNFQLGTRCN